jgi:hypothetical protein
MNAKNRTLLPIALAVGAAAGLSFANDPMLPTHDSEAMQYTSERPMGDTLSQPSMETRSQVQGPVIGAEAAGLIERGEATAPEAEQKTSQSYLRRDFVQAEAAEAYRLGLVAQGESYPEPTPAQVQQMQMAAERQVMNTQLAQVDGTVMPSR